MRGDCTTIHRPEAQIHIPASAGFAHPTPTGRACKQRNNFPPEIKRHTHPWKCAQHSSLLLGLRGNPLWCIRLETLVALGHKPVGLPALIPCGPSDADDFRIEALRYDIGRIFADNPFKWYAMRFRPGVRYADIKSRFEAIKDEITIPEVFFPCEEIAHKIGRKLVYENKPVIPGVLFFRGRVTDISPLFYRIGDLAWCYRDRSSATRAYATVPESDMRAFQLAIGVFTPETEIYPIGCAPIYPSDIVKVIGGRLIGKTGVVDSIIEGPTHARLSTG